METLGNTQSASTSTTCTDNQQGRALTTRSCRQPGDRVLVDNCDRIVESSLRFVGPDEDGCGRESELSGQPRCYDARAHRPKRAIDPDHNCSDRRPESEGEALRGGSRNHEHRTTACGLESCRNLAVARSAPALVATGANRDQSCTLVVC